MELKNKIKQIILRVICGIFLITTLFLGVVAACYSISGGTPNIFGTYIYLVKTDAFDLLENGTALVAQGVPERIHPSEIQPWNIVVFTLENGEPALAEIRSGGLSDGVYSFEAATENGTLITLSQSQIVAMGTSYSDIWGKIISFATSPLGVLLVAVVPCLVIIIIELSKFISRTLPQPEIETVKKQLEVPTYTPESGRAGAVNAYKKSGSSLDDSIGLYDSQVRRNSSLDRTDVLEISAQESPLFLGPKHKPITIQNQKRTQTEQMPLSQKRLNDAIAAAKAEREARAEREINAERERTVKDIQKSRGAAIAAEKEYENYLKTMQTAVTEQKKSAPKTEPVQPSTATAPKPKPASPEKKADSSKIQKPAARKEKEFTPEFKSSQNVQAARPQTSRTAQLPKKPAEAASEIDDNVKQYTPRKAASAVTHATTSIPRLDALLNEEVDEGSYNIDDILASLDRRG